MNPLVAKQIVVINEPNAAADIGSNTIYYNIYILFEIVYHGTTFSDFFILTSEVITEVGSR